MKKFSQITESYDYDEEKFKRHPAVNKEFWDSKVQPLIDTMFAVSPTLFQKYTMDNLLNLVRSINQDYVTKRKSEVKKDTNLFFKMFDIDTTKDDIDDYVQELSDNCHNKENSTIIETGEYYVYMSDFNYVKFDNFVNDLKGVYGKLCMIEGIDHPTEFEIDITYKEDTSYKGSNFSNIRKGKLPKEKYGGGKIDIDQWLSLSALENINQLNNLVIEIYIFNPSFRWKSS